MTINEIYEQVLLDVPNIPMRNFIKRYNKAVEILALNYDTANAPKTDYIDSTDNEQTWYDLPLDCRGVNKVIDENGTENKSYICEKGKINLGHSGVFTIEYIGVPTVLNRLENRAMQTGIDSAYHVAITEYILAYEIPDKFDFHYALFEDLSAKAHIRLKSVKRKNIRIAAPRWQ